MNKYTGMLAAASAYILWGVLPAYWKLLQAVPAYEILCHRMVWSLLLTIVLVYLYGRQTAFRKAVRERRNLMIPLSSLGLLQYLAPSINLVLGVFVYGEDFSRPRMIGFSLIWLALGLYLAENIFMRFRHEKKVLEKKVL